MSQTIIGNDCYINGAFSCATATLPASCVGASNVEAAAGIEASKLEHCHVIKYEQPSGSAITAATVPIHIVRGATATVLGIKAFVCVAATGTDRTLSVDLKSSTGGAAFSTMLSSTVNLNYGTAINTPQSGTLSATSLVATDCLELVVAVGGALNAQSQGLCVLVWVAEDYT